MQREFAMGGRPCDMQCGRAGMLSLQLQPCVICKYSNGSSNAPAMKGTVDSSRSRLLMDNYALVGPSVTVASS